MTVGGLLTFIIIAALIIAVGSAIAALILLARMKALQGELGELRQEYEDLKRSPQST